MLEQNCRRPGASSADRTTAEQSYEVSEEAVAIVRKIAENDKNPGEVIFIERTEKIEDYLRAGDIFVSASVREGMPNALLEAMACGLACLAARLPGITDSLLRKQGQECCSIRIMRKSCCPV